MTGKMYIYLIPRKKKVAPDGMNKNVQGDEYSAINTVDYKISDSNGHVDTWLPE
jgi:hypothetical protein